MIIITQKYIRSLNACSIADKVVDATWGLREVPLTSVGVMPAPITEKYYLVFNWCCDNGRKDLSNNLAKSLYDLFLDLLSKNEQSSDPEFMSWSEDAKRFYDTNDIEIISFGLIRLFKMAFGYDSVLITHLVTWTAKIEKEYGNK